MLKAYVGSPPLASFTQSCDDGTQDSWRAAWQKYVFSDDLISPEG